MTQTQSSNVLLDLEGVHKYYPIGGRFPWLRSRGLVRAVDGVSFNIKSNETLGLVGESGCGKTTTAKLILLLERLTSGKIFFKGEEINQLSGERLNYYRRSVQAVFQDPWSSLNPRHRGKYIVAEPLIVNSKASKGEIEDHVREILLAVGLNPRISDLFPHELSGGMRQRLAVARALAPNPSLVILDEPVSALDVSIRAQIMNLLNKLQEKFGIAYLLIAHDLATVRYLSHKVAVMYVGEIVEIGSTEEIFIHALHPYTKALISAAVPIRPGEEEEIVLRGEVPSPASPPPGCRFHPRCPVAFERCPKERPRLRELASDHNVACHLYEQ